METTYNHNDQMGDQREGIHTDRSGSLLLGPVPTTYPCPQPSSWLVQVPAITTALALSYDPTIRLHMVSANGGVDQSLGLARNVPFLVGTITLYLQVHVLRAPAYDILLGRPFDVLTQLVVRNFSDENQTITILDPNTGRKATVPTIPRGTFRFAECNPHKCKIHEQDF